MNLQNRTPWTVAGLLLALGFGGCAHAPAKSPGGATRPLAGTAWQIDRIGARAALDPEHTLVRFGTPGEVSGSTGCNNFRAGAALGPGTVTFDDPVLTRRACPEPMMEQEHTLIESLVACRRYAWVGDSRLELLDASGRVVLRLSRIGR